MNKELPPNQGLSRRVLLIGSVAGTGLVIGFSIVNTLIISFL